MKHKKIISASLLTVLLQIVPGDKNILLAGNEDRSGQAGAAQLLINPWARSSALGNANIASVRGLEAQFLNVAGIAFTQRTELLFARTNYLSGSGIAINAFGFTQKVGEAGVLGLGFMSMDFGKIEVTTTEMPEGGLGTYPLSCINIGASYARKFTDHIFGGMNFKVIHEGIPDARAGGVALDAGIQYVTGKYDHIKFGIALKNVGPKMKYKGDGLSFRDDIPTSGSPTSSSALVMEHRAEAFELPSLLNIGGAYDYYIGSTDTANKTHRISLCAGYTSNSFAKDEYKIGIEYGFKEFLMLRLGYNMEKGIRNNDDTKTPFRTTVHTGLNAGFTVQLPLNKEKGSVFGLDYSYRATQPFNGTHSLGLRIDL